MKRTAIVIDDDEISLLLLSNALQQNNFNVITSSSGSETYDLYLKHQAHVIICDIFMPDIDGFEVIKMIRKVDDNALIVAISANNLFYLKMAKKLGANLTFHKLTSPQTIINTINNQLNIKEYE